MAGLTEKETKELVRKEVEDYFRESRPGYEIVSNAISEVHGQTEYCMTTDTSQGLHFYKNGISKYHANKSIELIAGQDAKENGLGIGIQTKNGDIIIHATNGDLVLKGRNVLIHTENDKDGFVDVQGTARVDIFAPKIIFNSNQIEGFAKLDMKFLGGHIQLHSQTTDVELTSGDVLGFMPIGSSIAGALMTDATKFQLYWPLSS